MESYPLAEQYDDALENYQLRLFEESTSLSRISDIEQFIKNFPESPYLSQAQDKLYELYTVNAKLSEYISFIENYPYNPNVEAAWESIYKIETEKLSPEILVNFLLEYPHYPNKDKVKEELINLFSFLFPASLNEKWGFIDTSGVWIIRPIYDS